MSRHDWQGFPLSKSTPPEPISPFKALITTYYHEANHQFGMDITDEPLPDDEWITHRYTTTNPHNALTHLLDIHEAAHPQTDCQNHALSLSVDSQDAPAVGALIIALAEAGLLVEFGSPKTR